MFIVLLKFSSRRGEADQYVDGHKKWIKRGLADGVFLVVGSLKPKVGGAILAHNTSLPDLHSRVSADPFVAEGIVSPEILEILPSQTDARMQFLLD